MPRSKKEQRSEETKRAILTASGQLFAERGYDAVTMREIARAAGCSHTTIYLYFTDKEALLHQLSMEPLQELREQIESAFEQDVPPEDRVRTIFHTFIRFCFLHRNMYPILFMTKGSHVDEATPALDVQRMRNEMFGLLRRAVADVLPAETTDELLWAYARIFFFTLHGIVGTYTTSEEPVDVLFERLDSTFELAADVMLAGFQHTVTRG